MSSSSEPNAGTVVYWNNYYDGMWHFLAIYDGHKRTWHLFNGFDEPYQVDPDPIEPPEDAVVVHVGGNDMLTAEQFNEAMYQYYKKKRYTYK